MSAKLKLTGFQRECLEHALGVDYDYEEYDDRDDLTVEQCRDAHDWIWGKLMKSPYEAKWKPITITIPDDILESVVYVLDNAVDASVLLADGYMYMEEYGVPEGLADAIIARTKDLIEVKIARIRRC